MCKYFVPGRSDEQNAKSELTRDILTLLYYHGANLELKDKRGRTALHQACRSNNIIAVDFLLNNELQLTYMPEGEYRHADINAQSSGGETPLMMAIDEGNIHVMQLLFAQAQKPGGHGPDPSL